jgi:hypothetical protein
MQEMFRHNTYFRKAMLNLHILYYNVKLRRFIEIVMGKELYRYGVHVNETFCAWQTNHSKHSGPARGRFISKQHPLTCRSSKLHPSYFKNYVLAATRTEAAPVYKHI